MGILCVVNMELISVMSILKIRGHDTLNRGTPILLQLCFVRVLDCRVTCLLINYKRISGIIVTFCIRMYRML